MKRLKISTNDKKAVFISFFKALKALIDGDSRQATIVIQCRY